MMPALSQTSEAQSNPNLDNGIKAYGAYDAGSIDHVDLATGALSVTIPVASFSQRGSLAPINVEIHYASKEFNINGHCVTPPNGAEPNCEPQWQSMFPFGNSFGSALLFDYGTAATTPTTLVISPQGKHVLLLRTHCRWGQATLYFLLLFPPVRK